MNLMLALINLLPYVVREAKKINLEKKGTW
jgi:hypothetical protein